MTTLSPPLSHPLRLFCKLEVALCSTAVIHSMLTRVILLAASLFKQVALGRDVSVAAGVKSAVSKEDHLDQGEP